MQMNAEGLRQVHHPIARALAELDASPRTEGPGHHRDPNGTARRIEMTHAEVERTMAGTGLTRYLGANAFGAHRIRRALQQACAHGEGDRVVWQTP